MLLRFRFATHLGCAGTVNGTLALSRWCSLDGMYGTPYRSNHAVSQLSAKICACGAPISSAVAACAFMHCCIAPRHPTAVPATSRHRMPTVGEHIAAIISEQLRVGHLGLAILVLHTIGHASEGCRCHPVDAKLVPACRHCIKLTALLAGTVSI